MDFEGMRAGGQDVADDSGSEIAQTMARTGSAATRQRATTGDWFLHRGVPHLIVDYSPSRDILPTLLLFSVFMFLNAEMWKVSAEIPPVLYVLTLGLFAGLGSASHLAT
ncbi:MAG: hypothetical protein ACR2JG_11425 [Geodermatophilaceae bacterium]